jgi:hypothetical protein
MNQDCFDDRTHTLAVPRVATPSSFLIAISLSRVWC